MKRSFRKRYLEPTLDYSTVPKSTLRRWKREGKLPKNVRNLSYGDNNTLNEPSSLSGQNMNDSLPDELLLCASNREKNIGPNVNLSGQNSPMPVMMSCVSPIFDDDCGIDNSNDENSSDAHDSSSDDECLGSVNDISREKKLFDRVYMFKESKLTADEMKTMIYCLSIRHRLSKEARGDFMELARILAGWPKQSFAASEYMLKKIFDAPANTLKQVHYCDECKTEIHHTSMESKINLEIVCPNNACLKTHELSANSNNMFITVDVADQLKALLQNKSIFSKLSMPYQSTTILSNSNERYISDISDGELYKKLLRNGIKFELTYNFNLDGAPVFNSSKLSMWPIQLIINELPPKDRFRNVIFAGVWTGKGEPNNHLMNTILKTFTDQATKLHQDGITFVHPYRKEMVTLRLLPLIAPVDSVARPLLQNRLQFNGYYGCSWCFHPGVCVDRQVKYPNLNKELELRTHKAHLEDLKQSAASNYTRVRGIKGPSTLLCLPHFDIVWSMPPECMHGVVLGVVRQLWDLWVTYNPATRLTFYLGAPKIKKINERLLSIKPPSEIHRLSRPLNEKNRWKATEWRSWLLFYSIPCLQGILNNVHFEHFSLLVNAIASLLSTKISIESLALQERNLEVFVHQFEDLYGSQSMTFNVHSLLHLTHAVWQCGPLWANSTFPFESEMFHVKEQVHCPVGVAKQIATKMHQKRHCTYYYK